MPCRHFRDALPVVPVGGVRPPDRPAHGLSSIFVADGVFGAFVERHQNIAAECELHVNGRLGSEGMSVTVQVRMEHDALLGDLANAGKAKDLKSTRIGENGARPGHEAVQSPKLTNQLVAGTKIKMIGIAENNACIELFGEIALRKSLDSGLCPYRHKDGLRERQLRPHLLGLDFERDLGHLSILDWLGDETGRRRPTIEHSHTGG